MEEGSPAAVTTAFLERFGDGEFDEADALIHPDGPLDGAGEMAALFSLLLTDVLATLVLGAIPTAVTETTVIEAGPTAATVDATLDVAGAVSIDARVELRPGDRDDGRDRRDERGGRGGRGGRDERDHGDGRGGDWRVWNVDLER